MLSLTVRTPARLKVVSATVPYHRRPVAKILGDRHEQFTKITGIKEVACGRSTLDLCRTAALEIDEHESVDALILVTQTPSDQIPATANLLAKQLGLKQSILAFDINQSCSGYVYGLMAAFSLVNSGVGKVLLCVGDDLHSISGQNTAALFGSGGSATLVERDDKMHEYPFWFYSDPAGYTDILCEKGSKIVMNGDMVFQFATGVVGKFLESTYHEETLVLHQANKQILDRISKRLGVGIFSNLNKWGNTSSASIPLVLCDSDFHHDGNLFLCGFGAGLSIAALKLYGQDFKTCFTFTL